MSQSGDPNDSIKLSESDFNESLQSIEKPGVIAPNPLGHDGSSLRHSYQPTHSPTVIPTSYIGVEEGYCSIKVPDHVDDRTSYGRRKTQDFGYPGARLLPRSTNRNHKAPLRDPGSWIKRACGHFSAISNIELRKGASQKPCHQCRAKHLVPAPEVLVAKRHFRRNEGPTDTPTASRASYKESSGRCYNRRQHHSEHVASDQCGDVFARDLGCIIDSILEEHGSTLQSVIANIQYSQPHLTKLRRVPRDLIQQSESEHGTFRSASQSSWSHHHKSCRSADQPCQRNYQPCDPIQQVCDRRLLWPDIPPKAVERLNVGSSGQLGLNLNDTPANLKESTKSLEDLIYLVRSAADDLGTNLDQRPTAEDDERFEQAPFERYLGSVSLEPVEARIDVERSGSEDTWPREARRQLTELVETRSQLLDEVAVIAEHLDSGLNERCPPTREFGPYSCVLDQVS